MNAITKACAVLTLALALASPGIADGRDQVEQWREDIQFYHSALQDGHINLYHSVSEQRFSAELERLMDRLPVLTEDEIVVEMMRITRLINDGHTQFPIMSGPHRHYPLRFFMIDDSVYVRSASDTLERYLGARVVSIDGVPIAAVLARIEPIVQPAENKYGLMHSLAFHLTVDNMLFGAGVTQAYGSAEFVFETSDSTLSTEIVTSLPMSEYLAKTTNWIEQHTPFPEADLVLNDDLWITADPQTRTAYFHFAAYPAFEDMLRFGPLVGAYLAENNVRNIIIDLRENGGGDFYVGLALSSPILMTDSVDWRNGVYILTGRTTFSAAMSNAAQFRQILNARLIGEPTGANPVSYSEVGQFSLPNSGRQVIYSKRLYRFQAENTPGIQPDVFIQPTVDQFRTGEDPVLNWVMTDIRSRQD